MTDSHLAFGPGAEFDLIRRIIGRLGSRARSLGDDSAVVPPGPGQLLVSTDASVEGVHWRTGWISLEEAGYRATAAALSDLAAMGAAPAGVVVALVVPREATPESAVLLMSGVGQAVEDVKTAVLGGDLTRGSEWVVSVTVLGWAERPVLRSGASPGEEVWVTGSLGGARAALVSFLAGIDPAPDVRPAFAAPTPRLAAGRWLAAHGATAMIDVSDGTLGDLGHLAAASGVGIILDPDAVPVHPGVAPVARRLGISPIQMALTGGEDYELLVTLPAGGEEDRATRCLADTGVTLTRIGVATTEQGRVRVTGDTALPERGFDHFA